jgi:hypothetical protein
LFVIWAVIGLTLSLAGSTAAHEISDPQPGEKIDRSMPVDPQPSITLCVASGTLKVRAWDKNEVHVRSLDAAQIDFRRIDRIKDTTKPANRVDVMVWDRAGLVNPKVSCQAVASVEMDVPAGATVRAQTRDGDITISGIAVAYAGSQNGDIMIDHVKEVVEVGNLGGSIFLKDSTGRVNLNSASGIIEVVNLRSATDDDTLEVGTVSGDILLNRVSSPTVNAKTVNGTVTMTGPLTKSGAYTFTNMAGDLMLAMPSDASFKLNAKLSEKHDIVSDFVLKYLNEVPAPPAARPARPARPVAEGAPKPPAVNSPPRTGPVPIVVARPAVATQYVLKRVTAICGTGDATISIASFGGTIRLKKI